MAVNCTKGKPCGDTCIDKKETCTLSQTASALLNSLKGKSVEKDANKIVYSETRATISDLEAAKTIEEQRKIVAALSTRLPPDQITEILDTKLLDGRTIRDLGASADAKGKYQLDTMKLRKVSDQEVDAIYDGLSSEQRNLLIPASAGAPARGEGDRVKEEWQGNTDMMRRAMLKTLLEQSLDDGTVIDPWTRKPLSMPANLDHIVPLNKGGGHGVKKKGDLATGYDSDNWTWVKPEINRNYKGDSDLKDTIQKLAEHEKQGETGYNDDLDKLVKNYLEVKKPLLELQDNTLAQLEVWFGLSNPPPPPGIPKPEIVDTFTKKEQSLAILKAGVAVGALKGVSENLKKAKPETLKKVAKGVLKAFNENLELTKAAVESLAVLQKYGGDAMVAQAHMKKIPTNNAIKAIFSRRDSIASMTDAEMHRVVDRLQAVRPKDTMPDYVRNYLYERNNTKMMPRERLSKAQWTWARLGRPVPDLKSLTPVQQDKIMNYLKNQFDI